ncbi:MAG TPA: AIR synthase-related protein [Dehalococcoidia bacterium]|nr:AIR synthase-related protein [Dehalococcoidia bacterium]
MRLGKLPPELLARALGELVHRDPRVRLGPRPGEDAGIVDLGAATLVVTTDPITFVSEDLAWYVVQVNANDIAATGAEPAWLALTALLPPAAAERDVMALFAGLQAACESLGVEVITGHTEVTDAVTRPVLAGTMVGLAPAEGPVRSDGARPGDALIVAGAVGVEGTAALAAEARAALIAAGLTAAQTHAASSLLREPGISVLNASRSLRRACRPHALHDATEGGVATAIRELAEASAVGVRVDLDALPLLPITRGVCHALDLDPLGLISSGCLLAAVAPEDAGPALARLHGEGILAARAGTFTRERTLIATDDRGERPLPAFDRDELARYVEQRAG